MTGIAPATNKGGILLQLMEEIQVEALPSDLPDKFEINIKDLKEIGQSIALKEVKVGSGVKLVSEDLESLIVKIEEPAKEEDVKPTQEATELEGEEGESDSPKDGKPEEGKEVEDSKTEDKKEDTTTKDKDTETDKNKKE